MFSYHKINASFAIKVLGVCGMAWVCLSKKKVEEEPKRSHQSYEEEIEAKLKIIAKDWFDRLL